MRWRRVDGRVVSKDTPERAVRDVEIEDRPDREGKVRSVPLCDVDQGWREVDSARGQPELGEEVCQVAWSTTKVSDFLGIAERPHKIGEYANEGASERLDCERVADELVVAIGHRVVVTPDSV